jgi:deoxyribose-phosphate aldolase
METEKILSLIDHTLLGVTATWDDIKEICDERYLRQRMQ